MIIAVLSNATSFEKKYIIQQNLYDFLGKKYKKIYFINICNIFNKKKVKINHEFFKKKNIIHFSPNTIAELNDFLNKNDIFLINNLSFQFKLIPFHYLVSKKNIFQISFDNTFQVLNYKIANWTHASFLAKIKFLFTKKISLILYRILIILRIINQIDTLYVSQKKVFARYKPSHNKKTLFIKKYKKIKTTSVRLPLIENKIKKTEKYITFIDQNILHEDFLTRGHVIDKEMTKKYFLFLKIYLTNLKKKFHKEIIICLHPSSNHYLYKKNLKEFKICKYKTEKYIINSFLVLFQASTGILSAIMLKKKIISLKSTIQGPYAEARRLYILNRISLVNHDMEKNLEINKKKLTNELNNNVKNYEKMINKIYYTNKNSLSIEKIIDTKIQKLQNNLY
tara:strand:- start:1776 stop:2960 length:1185 start_codon:yes stop_codon:yes gene_type:complete